MIVLPAPGKVKTLAGPISRCRVGRAQRAPPRLVYWRKRWGSLRSGKKGTGPICAKHPPGRSGKLDLSPFSLPDLDNRLRTAHDSIWEVPPDQRLFHSMTARRKWRIVVLAVVAAVACLVHAPLLRGLAGLLIVDQPTDDYDCVCISSWGRTPSGDRCYDVAADLYQRKPSCRILLVAPDVNRLEQTGVVPSFESMSRRELRARHVPQEAVSVLRGEQWNDWATAASAGGLDARSPRPLRAVAQRCIP